MGVAIRPKEEDLNKEVLRIFMKSISLLGGPRKLIEYRNLTWLPSLMEACYAIALKNRFKTEEEIARELGVTKPTVRRILESDPDAVMRKLRGEEIEKFDEHVAGGIAKLAWNEIKKGREDVDLMIDASRRVLEGLGGPVWAILTLMRIKGLDFPIDESKVLEERLRGIKVFDLDLGEVVRSIAYPVANPAELLSKLSKEIKRREEG